MRNRSLSGAGAIGSAIVLVLVAGCGGRMKKMMEGDAKISNERVSGGSSARPSVIYVADFTVAPGTIQPPKGFVDQTTNALAAERPHLLGGGGGGGGSGGGGGLLGGGLLGGGGILGGGEGAEGGGGGGGRVLDSQPTPEQIVNVLATSITDSLNQMQIGVSASRLPPGAPPPESGWLVRGAFTSVDPGSRAQRAVIGFGVGEASAEVQTEVDELGSTGPKSIADFGGSSDSGKSPGAVVTMNPYAAAAKFMIAKGATVRDVKSMGEAIAKRVAALIETPSPGSGPS